MPDAEDPSSLEEDLIAVLKVGCQETVHDHRS